MSTVQRGLSDSDAYFQIDQMVRFIRLEAAQKIKELQMRTSRELSTRRATLKKEEDDRLAALRQDELNRLLTKSKVDEADLKRSARKTMLDAMNKHLLELQKQSAMQAIELKSRDPSAYGQLLDRLAAQAIVRLTSREREDDRRAAEDVSSFVREVLLVVHPDDRQHFGSPKDLERVRALVMEQRRRAHDRAMQAWKDGGGEGEHGGSAPVLDEFVPSVSLDPHASLGLRRASDLTEVEAVEEEEDGGSGGGDSVPGELPDLGVVATSADRLVECDNRLLSRLEGVLHGAQPVIRAALFPATDFSIGPAIEKAIARAKAGGESGAGAGEGDGEDEVDLFAGAASGGAGD